MSRSSRLIGCSLAALTLVFALRCYSTYRVFNDTKDEAAHIASGLEVWDRGRYTIDLQHPPLARLALGLAALLGGLHASGVHDLWATGSVDSYWRTLTAAREHPILKSRGYFLRSFCWP